MIQAYLIINTNRFVSSYLSNPEVGSIVVNGAAVTVRPVVRRGLPIGVTALILTVEDTGQRWSAAIEVLKRGTSVWRSTIEGHYASGDQISSEAAGRLYLNWLLTT